MKRITPARAGKRYTIRSRWFAIEDHPRTRGEKDYSGSYGTAPAGSPPHARGKELLSAPPDTCFRITPARAGKSEIIAGSKAVYRITPARAGKRVQLSPGSPVTRDHPRTRGEKVPLIRAFASSLGSPPHARGKVCFDRCRHLQKGITPARAGKSIIAIPILHCT